MLPTLSVESHKSGLYSFKGPMQKSQWLRISVIDSGYGLSKENQVKLFKEVVQFNANAQQGGGGSGLGLWLTKKIVDLHGGRVGVYSEGEGKGSTFFMEIPIAKTEPVEEAVSSHIPISNLEPIVEASPSSLKNRMCKSVKPFASEKAARLMDSVVEESEFKILNVLVVDDSALNRKMTSKVLSSLGHNTAEADDGRDAVAKIAGTILDGSPPFDVILMDNCNFQFGRVASIIYLYL